MLWVSPSMYGKTLAWYVHTKSLEPKNCTGNSPTSCFIFRMLCGTSLAKQTSAGHHLEISISFQIFKFSSLTAEVRCAVLGPDLKRPHLTHRMSLKRGLFPALQSLQNQLPWGISMFKHSWWKAAGQDSQHRRLPPANQHETAGFVGCTNNVAIVQSGVVKAMVLEIIGQLK